MYDDLISKVDTLQKRVDYLEAMNSRFIKVINLLLHQGMNSELNSPFSNIQEGYSSQYVLPPDYLTNLTTHWK
jgi:hypothetical protein